mgnify:FL=1
MLKKYLKQFIQIGRGSNKTSYVPDGERLYIVGDIHGRLDLFSALHKAIEADISQHPDTNISIILLGDLIDRGPDSAGVIKLAMDWQRTRQVRILAGNHEEMFLQSFEDIEVLRHFLKHGGKETILSFDLSLKEYRELTLEELYARLPQLVPKKIRQFLADLEEIIILGDYVFVPAGINPDRDLNDQSRNDLLWIRERFLKHKSSFAKVVVHGHTISEAIEIKTNRIGLDTGAFRTGILSALVLEGNSRSAIQAVDKDNTTSIICKNLSF